MKVFAALPSVTNFCLPLSDDAAKVTNDVSKMTSQRVRDALVAEHEKVLKAQADNELLQVCPDDVT